MDRTVPAPAAWVRQPAVAGRFYPADPSELGRAVRFHLDRAAGVPMLRTRGLIVPHAGYACSAPVAAHAFKTLSPPVRGPTVYLMGPAHWSAIHGIGLCTAYSFATPLGPVPVATQQVSSLLQKGGLYEAADAAHQPEHCLEVHLPFLQVVLGQFQIVPMLFGPRAGWEQAGHDLVELMGDETSVVLVSSDLSHYHPYEKAVRVDRAFLAGVVAGDLAAVRGGEACGLLPILCLMQVARTCGWTPRLLDYRNSGDTCGPRSEVVGYGAVVYGAAEQPPQ
jgi:AmmeMemoRadiSam system protein B